MNKMGYWKRIPKDSLAPKSNSPIGNGTYDLFSCFKRGLFPTYERDFGQLVRGIEDSVLDLGCGFGSDFMLWLRERTNYNGRMINMDRDPAVFDDKYRHADMNYWNQGDLNIVGDATNIPLKDGSVALVHQQGLFADFEDKVDSELVFREVHRILQPSGLYVINDTVELPKRNFVKLAGDPIYPQGAYRKI